MKNAAFIRIYLIFLSFFFLSCTWFESREKQANDLVKKELQNIDWNDVDHYPLFDDCDETVPKPEQRECFEKNLLLYFSMALRDYNFRIEENMIDTIYVDFLVDRDGRINVLEIEQNQEVQSQLPEFNRVITQSMGDLPRIAPALKRGHPVNVKFRIPIALNSN